MATTKAATTGMATLQRLKEEVVAIEIRGVTPYIPHRWSEKAKAMMPGHPDKPKLREQKGVRQPEEEAESCLYTLPDGRPGLPATAIKAAMVGACRQFEGVTMTNAKVAFRVVGEGPDQLIPFTYGERILREDTPRNSNGGADLRYRYMFTEWRAVVTIRFLASVINEESLVALLDAAGRGGIGEWRPSSPKSATGTYGVFEVDAEEAL